ncbi:transposase [Moorena sp. SIO1F2]|uniref:transposase n=1 Tax=Moorena sp. SIO1F2 TaxID=2607819 RepID=UPI0025DE72CE|nr:transposase [Moorena sp. SIO1F2]
MYGYDGGKKVKGRKRHLVVDSQGLMIGVLVTEGNAPERLGAATVRARKLRRTFSDRNSLGRWRIFGSELCTGCSATLWGGCRGH